VTVIRGGAGTDSITLAEGKFMAGAVIITGTNPGAGGLGDILTINGSTFAGGLTAILYGPNAEIDINDGGGYQPTIFSGLFHAIMIGSRSLIVVANGSGSGYSPVTFGGAMIAIGANGAGDLFKYHKANVIGPIIAIFFTEVPV
jgi:hypothetical protein